ncbi:DegT/DnrJ/EryC1/StrS family aminotransferase [Rheinheimera tangshanensis]|uniref:DegT/DnrJ/EryC1/StrS family aminotransferase n=1 Tax=Rheinheimera tangshanensis TaxID=400153 RepID=A0A5C8LT40_9GAMM|nr:DegT/DnrJ/EryC1/StrS family aminotransferase [Rheinheimera tangshanensis]TXK80486.1 DegT/DnrJ/EryC1/StrS family aminotransferase [Rheinheimera tangshanensis]GGM60944.1 polysaccharide biosynthesis protein [Rheinheimera tangshanensis]
MIPVNKPYLPAFSKYSKYLEQAYARNWLTNNGPLVQELKLRLEDYLGVKNLMLVANGTLSMQLAYKVFALKGNAVTTPFTFIATSSSLQWEHIRPVFADIDPKSYCLSLDSVKKHINNETTAVVPVHVYGNPCDVDGFEKLRESHGLKIIYDAAHAFGVKVNGKSVLHYGDASSLSFHATKVFHSVEGGAVIFRNSDDYERAMFMTNFGIDTSDGSIVSDGINTKMSEVHAAMGLAVLDDIDLILAHRTALFELYLKELTGYVRFPVWHEKSNYNGAYIAVTFSSAEQCTKVLEGLKNENIIARRYFAPSLNTLDIYCAQQSGSCPVSEHFASATICLPLYFSLTEKEVIHVCNTLKRYL